MSNERKYDAIPGTAGSDYTSIDPEGYSALASGGIQDVYNIANTGLGENSNPLATFLSETPQLQDLVLGSSSDLGRMLQDQTRQYTQQAVQDVGQDFSGLGSLYSGAARDAAGKRATQAAGQAATQLGQQQLGMAGNLYNQAFGNNQRMQDMFANLLGQNTGIQAQFGTPAYAAQQYSARPTFWETAGQLLGSAMPLIGAAVGGPAGAAAGAAASGARRGGGRGADFDMSEHRPERGSVSPSRPSPYRGGFRPSDRL